MTMDKTLRLTDKDQAVLGMRAEVERLKAENAAMHALLREATDAPRDEWIAENVSCIRFQGIETARDWQRRAQAVLATQSPD